MKKLIFTLALSFSISGVFAFKGMSELNVKMYDNSMFYVVLDNVTYNSPQQSFSFSKLSSGKHFLKVVKIKPNFNSFGYSYQQKKVFSGYVYIPANRRIYSEINNFNKFVIVSTSVLLGECDVVMGYGSSGCYNDYNEDYGEGMSNCYNVSGYGYTPVIAPAKFSALMSVMDNSSFDSSKQNLAKQALASNWFTSAQVCQMLKLFTFESSRLAIAKIAYAKTIDKGNYFIVNNAFTFESSIDELSDYIGVY